MRANGGPGRGKKTCSKVSSFRETAFYRHARKLSLSLVIE